MQHGLQARIDALVTWRNNKDAVLIRPGVNLWYPFSAGETHRLRHWNDDPHIVLEIDAIELQPELLKHRRAAWFRYFADIPVSAILVSERQLRSS